MLQKILSNFILKILSNFLKSFTNLLNQFFVQWLKRLILSSIIPLNFWNNFDEVGIKLASPFSLLLMHIV